MRYILWGILMILNFHLYAQDFSQIWLKTSSVLKSYKLGNYEFELQKRMTFKPATTSSLNSGRFWIHLPQSKKVGLSISPFAYFEHFTNDKVGLKINRSELRGSIAGNYNIWHNAKIKVFNRSAVEARHFEKAITMFRFRNRIASDIDLNSQIMFRPSYEVFFTEYKMEQMRVNMSMKNNFHKKITSELGFISVFNCAANCKMDKNLLLNLNYTI